MEGGGEGEGEGEGVPAKESMFVNILRKIDEAYTWVKTKLNSLFKLFSESILEALLGLRSFVTSCCEKLREVLSWINTQIDNLSGKKKAGGEVPEAASLLGELKMLVQKMRNQCSEVRKSLGMKVADPTLNRFLDLVEGFIELLEYAYKQPSKLIRVIFHEYLIWHSNKKAGGVKRVVWRTEKAAMAIHTILEFIAPSKYLVVV